MITTKKRVVYKSTSGSTGEGRLPAILETTFVPMSDTMTSPLQIMPPPRIVKAQPIRNQEQSHDQDRTPVLVTSSRMRSYPPNNYHGKGTVGESLPDISQTTFLPMSPTMIDLLKIMPPTTLQSQQQDRAQNSGLFFSQNPISAALSSLIKLISSPTPDQNRKSDLPKNRDI